MIKIIDMFAIKIIEMFVAVTLRFEIQIERFRQSSFRVEKVDTHSIPTICVIQKWTHW